MASAGRRRGPTREGSVHDTIVQAARGGRRAARRPGPSARLGFGPRAAGRPKDFTSTKENGYRLHVLEPCECLEQVNSPAPNRPGYGGRAGTIALALANGERVQQLCLSPDNRHLIAAIEDPERWV